MGYCMTYWRVLRRNNLGGDYDGTGNPPAQTAGDLRRLERNQRDELHLAAYAAAAGITPEQTRIVLDALFANEPYCIHERASSVSP